MQGNHRKQAPFLIAGPEGSVGGHTGEGLDDGEILEANQIICYFNYVNRSINGLGVTTEGDIVGYYKK